MMDWVVIAQAVKTAQVNDQQQKYLLVISADYYRGDLKLIREDAMHNTEELLCCISKNISNR